ncbi:MAG: SipW-dependent-type signal peptide-containing protein [Coriobacteriales bacterium]|jgi:predicted ribosomally synthesized peptide with SipW-like signal peptide|nr:SipW-dependent-type signal peptide-containing protein [Coriobacteriales bacterium]
MKQFLASKKAQALSILSLVLVVVLALGVTLAYFTDFDEVENVFTMGSIKIGLEEPGWEEGDGLDLVPGSVRDKDPTVTAVDGKSYMRIRMELQDGDGTLITDVNRINLILGTLYFDKAYGTGSPNILPSGIYSTSDMAALVAGGTVYAEYNKDEFEYAGIETGVPAARYYNYKGIFDASIPDVVTLFTSVVIPMDWSNEEIFTLHGSTFQTMPNGSVEVTAPGNGYKIVIKAEAIQSAEMPSAAAAYAALNEATGVTISS